MPGSSLAFAARDIASPSTSTKPVDMRNGRIKPESAPLANGGGSGARRSRRRKPTRRFIEEELGSAVDAETADLASFLARTSLDNHRPGGSSSAAPVSHQLNNAAAHTSQGEGPNVCDALYTLAAASQAPGLGNGVYFFAAPAIQGPNLGAGSSSGGGIAAPDAPVAGLNWGRKQRSRGRRDKPAPTPAPAPAPEPELTPAQARGRSASKNKKKKKNPAAEEEQAQAEEEKLMPPPSAGGPMTPIIIRDTSPPPTRAATRSHHRSVEVEEPLVAAADEQQQPAAKKKGKGKRKGKGKQTQPQLEASDNVPCEAGGSGEQQQPAPEAEPKQLPPRRRQPPRNAKEKGKAPVVAPATTTAAAAAAAMEKLKLLIPRVVVELTKEEIAEDWLAMTGKKLPKRAHHPRPNSDADKKIFNNTFPGHTLKSVPQRKYITDWMNSIEAQDSV